MIKHIVMFQFTEKVDEQNKDNVVAKLIQSMDNLNGKIPGMIMCEIGDRKSVV